MIITVTHLENLRACSAAVSRFREFFGKSALVTEEECVRHAADFDWDWAAEKLLTSAQWQEYKRIRARAYVEYERVKSEAWADYDRIEASAWAEYLRIQAAAQKEYEIGTAAARTYSNVARAVAFAHAVEFAAHPQPPQGQGEAR